MIYIDVRTEEEYDEGHRDGAILCPLQNIMRGDLGEIAVMDKNTELGLYCASGARSGVACQILGQMGFKNVTNLGGF